MIYNAAEGRYIAFYDGDAKALREDIRRHPTIGNLIGGRPFNIVNHKSRDLSLASYKSNAGLARKPVLDTLKRRLPFRRRSGRSIALIVDGESVSSGNSSFVDYLLPSKLR